MTYPKLILKPKREQSWIFGHPWIFSKAIEEAPKVEPGSLVSVYTHDGKSVGVGTFNPHQSIALRMLSHVDETIDTPWFHKRFAALKAYRRSFLKETNAYRLCFGESDGIPGLVIDQFADTAIIQVNTKGIERLLPFIREAINTPHIITADSISSRKENVHLNTPLSSNQEIWALENNLKILIPLQGGQKTGWFCDQRDNRALVGSLVKNQKLTSVLNLFSYTGGFSLAALQSGATRVVNLDQDAKALALFSQMAEANNLPPHYTNLCSDIWPYLQNEREQFDLVIVDPPAFVKEEAQKVSALRGYLNLFKKSIPKVKAGGFLMVYSCSHFVKEEDLTWVLRQAYQETGRFFQTVMPLGQPFDHPVPATFPESSYLKGFLLADQGSFGYNSGHA